MQSVCLSGGEVFFRGDLWELIDELIANRMRYSILTNGTLVTEKTLSYLDQGSRRQRLDSIQISIDGSCAEVHDQSRGLGSFQRAIRGLRLLKQGGFPVTVRVTINRHNVDDLENIARLLLEEIGVRNISTNDATPVGAGCLNKDTITLTAQQQRQAMAKLSGLASEYHGRISAQAGPLAKCRAFQEMEQARKTGEKTQRWQMGFLTACGGVFSKLAVHHDGIITPCNMIPGLELGRINIDPLSKIWKTHSTLEALRNRHSIPLTEVPECEGCEWIPFCNGSCPGPAYEMTGDFNRANLHDCYRRYLQEVT